MSSLFLAYDLWISNIIYLIVTGIFIVAFLESYKFSILFNFARKLNGPTFYPFIGCAYKFFGKNFLTAADELLTEYTLPMSVWIGHNYLYCTLDAHEVKEIITNEKTLDKAYYYSFMEHITGKSIVISPARIWKPRRRCLNASFTIKHLEHYFTTFNSKSLILMEKLMKNDIKDASEVFTTFTCDIFFNTLIGIDLQYQDSATTPVYEYLEKLTTLVTRRAETALHHFDLVYFNTSDGKIFTKTKNELHEFLGWAIEKKREIYEEKKLEGNLDDKKKILLDLLFETDKLWKNEDVVKAVVEFAYASSDTSGVTLAFACTLLGMHPEIQEHVYNEAINVIGHDSPIEYHHLKDLKYLERVLNETMRLFPAIPVVGRFATDDIDLGTRVLPKNSNILISIFHLHRSKKYWSEPLKFNPDRFLPDEVAQRVPYTFMPFSLGTRNCLGWRYAQIMMKTAMANMIRKVKFSSNYQDVADIQCISTVNLKTQEPLDCTFTARK